MRVRLVILSLFVSLFAQAQSTLKIESGVSVVSTGDPYINLYNTNLYNATGSADFTDGTIWALTGNSTTTGTTIDIFHGIRLNNPSGYTLGANTVITNKLEMVSGNINLAGHTLEVGTSPSNPGEINWTGGTIIGPLKRWFAPSTNSTQASGIFPIGNDGTNRNVTINYTQAPTEGGSITVEYKNGIPSMGDVYSGLPLWASDGQVVQNYENAGYFEITPDDYNSSLNTKQFTVSIRGNNLLNVNNNGIIRLIKSPGPSHTTWVPAGSHSSVSGTNSDFTVTSTGVTGFSWFNFGSQNENPLPVELLYFEGYAYPTFNNLRWSTASEYNSDYFNIEHSLDGEDWDMIGTKDAAGNSNQKINYGYMVSFSRFDINYYRLKQVDFDGSYKYYGPISLDNRVLPKKVVRYVNLAGQEVNSDSKGIIFEVYEDGTSKRIFNR